MEMQETKITTSAQLEAGDNKVQPAGLAQGKVALGDKFEARIVQGTGTAAGEANEPQELMLGHATTFRPVPQGEIKQVQIDPEWAAAAMEYRPPSMTTAVMDNGAEPRIVQAVGRGYSVATHAIREQACTEIKGAVNKIHMLVANAAGWETIPVAHIRSLMRELEENLWRL